MKLKNLFAITAVASALVLTGCKEEKKVDAASTAPAPTSIKVGVMAGPEHQVAETAAKVAKDKYNLNPFTKFCAVIGIKAAKARSTMRCHHQYSGSGCCPAGAAAAGIA